MRTVREARAALDGAVRAERRETLHRPRITSEDAARQAYYATRGMALAAAGPEDLAAEVRAALAAGNRAAAQEYLAVGGQKLRHHLGAEAPTLHRAAMHTTDAARHARTVGLDTWEQQLSRLDTWLQNNQDRLGHGDPGDPDAERQDVVAGFVSRWQETAEQQASDAAVASLNDYTAASREHGLDDA